MQKAYGPVKDAAEAAKISAIASERASTNNRAWLFVKFNTRDQIERVASTPRFGVDVNFQLQNFGQTPAIVTQITAHMFWDAGLSRFIEPGPGSETSRPMREDMFAGLFDIKNVALMPTNPPFERQTELPFGETPPIPSANQIIIPANESSGPMQGRFTFQRIMIPYLQRHLRF
jgi:hypothetical protein